MKILRFLGSIRFALLLIFLTAIWVIIGTLIESKSTSHALAESWVYHHPIFQLLLAGYFLNILISALLRWPFQWKHFPFLLTHLGLLMVILGVFVKLRFGVQGHLMLIEGTETSQVTLPQQQALHLETKNGTHFYYPLVHSLLNGWRIEQPQKAPLKAALKDIFPHGKEHLISYLIQDQLLLFGQPPVALGAKTHLPLLDNQEFAIYTSKDGTVREALNRLYNSHYQLIRDGQTVDTPRELILEPVPTLKIASLVEIPLQGPKALFNSYTTSLAVKSPPYELLGEPFLLVHQDGDLQTTVALGDAHGRLILNTLSSQKIDSWIAYGGGFQGYARFTELPLVDAKWDRKTVEDTTFALLAEELHRYTANGKPFAPPIELFKQAVETAQPDFAANLLHFLKEWDDKGGWLFKSVNPRFLTIGAAIDWSQLSDEDVNALYWITTLLKDIPENMPLVEVLQQRKWPLLDPLKKAASDPGGEEAVYTAFAQQIYAIRNELPKHPANIDAERSIEMLSAYFRLYDIHFQKIPLPEFELSKQMVALESPLFRMSLPTIPSAKKEELTPLAYIRFTGGGQTEEMALVYDPKTTKLKWPLFKGKYLARFEPHRLELPYTVRLHRSRDIKYPGSEQTLSYECEISIRENLTGRTTKCQLSMNNVHETNDGYRFYLSGMGVIDPLGVRSLQIVINRDPAKYWLTYPGGILVSLGIILLFWFKAKS